jgi:putative FmdB family regulatory protein
LPTYEYACRDCGQHVEVVQSFRDAALTTCGTCGGRLRKVYGTAGIIFKGSGYYVNDSRAPAKTDGGTKTDAGKDSAKEPAAKSGTKGEAKSEAKSEAKTEAKPASSGGESAA